MRFIAALLLALSLPAQVYAAWHGDTQSIMGTEIRVSLWHDDADIAEQATQAVMDEMRRIDATLSPYIETSDLARLNARASGEPVKLSPEFAYLVERSLYFSRISDGAFDITFASIGWHYDYRAGRKPDAKVEQQLLPAVNFRLLDFNPQQRTLRFGKEGMRIDLGGIAKGHAVDRAIEILRKFGVRNATVSAGGDSRILGDKRGQPWLVGIKNPRLEGDQARPVVLTLPLADTAVSTSGDYERYFIDRETGERVHHIINPRTGRSADSVMSVTVLGASGIDTDALSTTVFVLGVEAGLALIERLPGFDAVIIDAAGKVHYSRGLAPPEH